MKTLLTILFALMLASCSGDRMKLPKPPPPPPPPPEPELDYSDVRKHSFRSRQNLNMEKMRYEGSLWVDEASWGNLLRDHRARFRNDVLTITNLNDIITISEPEVPPTGPATGAAAVGEQVAQQANQAIDIAQNFLGNVDAEKEQNDVLRALKTISARVTKVLPNGNMVILGEKVDYKQANSIRYVTKIKGIIRPEDVTDKNEIKALKMARSEVQIKRQILAKKLNFGALAPAIGRQKAGLLDRIGHLATPTQRNQTTRVPTN